MLKILDDCSDLCDTTNMQSTTATRRPVLARRSGNCAATGRAFPAGTVIRSTAIGWCLDTVTDEQIVGIVQREQDWNAAKQVEQMYRAIPSYLWGTKHPTTVAADAAHDVLSAGAKRIFEQLDADRYDR